MIFFNQECCRVTHFYCESQFCQKSIFYSNPRNRKTLGQGVSLCVHFWITTQSDVSKPSFTIIKTILDSNDVH